MTNPETSQGFWFSLDTHTCSCVCTVHYFKSFYAQVKNRLLDNQSLITASFHSNNS